MTDGPAGGRGTLHLAFFGASLLLSRDGVLTVADMDHLGILREPVVPLDLDHPSGLIVTVRDVREDFALPDGYERVGLRELGRRWSPEMFRLAGTAFQKLEWFRTHQFCGRCGMPTTRRADHQAMSCTVCGHLHFPRVAPAVIVLIERGRAMLLGRSPRFAEGVYSTLAGFVEPGESIEDTIHREIREEVGVEVTDLRYFGSQPWPFPHSLMIGFTARWANGDIRIDGVEIEDARWFTPESLPPRLPYRLSIARRLVDDFLTRAPSA